MVYNPAHQWERYGAVDPYFGVLSLPAFRDAGLDEKQRERFFDTGRQHVAELAAKLAADTGSSLGGRRALDYGCGVGRVTLPLAEHCEWVYGVDVSPSMLREADRNARSMGVSNVEWVRAERLAELSGRYDLVQSVLVFQHIPVREGERIFATLLRGLSPGGVGAIHVTLRAADRLTGLFHWTMKTVPLAHNIFNVARGRAWSYPHMQMNSYSLERLGRLLADAGITQWHVRFMPGTVRLSHDSAFIVFRKA
jgi:2-polyprenyl-3-methyl-5-hydroxy-6-metoxy-1,4-benzoquinol methylase